MIFEPTSDWLRKKGFIYSYKLYYNIIGVLTFLNADLFKGMEYKQIYLYVAATIVAARIFTLESDLITLHSGKSLKFVSPYMAMAPNGNHHYIIVEYALFGSEL